MKFLKQIMKTGFAFMLSMALPAVAFAAGDEATGGTTEITQDLIELVVIAIQGLNMFLWPVLIMIGDLMDTDLIMGPGMDERLRALWVQVRNLVNMAFVLVLLAIAFYNVLGIGGGEGNLALKTALPKLILGLVLVNFTLPIGRVLIDVTNVATQAAFGLPEVTGQFDFKDQEKEFAQRMCYKKYDPSLKDDGETPNHVKWDSDNIDGNLQVQAFCAYTETEVESDSPEAEDGKVIKKTYTGQLNDFAKVNYFTDLNANNLGLIMAVNNQSLTQVMEFDTNKYTSWEDVTISLLFALVMYVIFAISYIALAILLFTRIIVLWSALVLSPIGVLVFVVPQIKEWMGGGGDVQQKIVKHLMAPIIVGLTYSLGYMLILAWDKDGRGNLSAADAQLGELMTADFLLSGINDLTDLMIAILSVVIIWVGVFAAAEGTIAQGATNAIKGFGEQIGGALAKAPLTIPTVPIASQGDEAAKVSPLAVAKLANQGLYQLDTGIVQGQMDKLLQDNKKLGEFFGYGGGNSSNPKDGADQVRNALSELDKTISPEELRRIAQGLMTTVQGSDIEEGKKKALIRELQTLSTDQNLTPEKLNRFQQMLSTNQGEITKALKDSKVAGAGTIAKDLQQKLATNSKLTLEAPAKDESPAEDKDKDKGGSSDDSGNAATPPASQLPTKISTTKKLPDGFKSDALTKALGDYNAKDGQTPANLKKIRTQLAGIKKAAETGQDKDGKDLNLDDSKKAALLAYHDEINGQLPDDTKAKTK